VACLAWSACGGEATKPSVAPPADGSFLPAPDAGDAAVFAPTPDAGLVDAQADAGGAVPGGSDAGAPDAACTPFAMPSDCTIPQGAVLPGDLRCTGLYGDWQGRKLACDVLPYTPAYQLWSDAAGKARYAYLPAGKTIDASSPDDFKYPVGTKFWKEFWVGPKGNQKLGETRYLLKDKLGWLYTTYVWSEDGSAAVQKNDGVTNLFGSGHGVPTRDQCKECHSGRPDFILGWDPYLLGRGASGTTLDMLMKAPGGPLLTGITPQAMAAVVPGDAVEQAALGYLHTNCGVSCHNGTTLAPAKMSSLNLRLEVATSGSVQQTGAVATAINRRASANAETVGLPLSSDQYYHFRPLDPMRSLSLARMKYRGSPTAMPPLASHLVDEEGVAIIKAWIEQMTPARGYPPAAP
jgi:hypothetical protein